MVARPISLETFSRTAKLFMHKFDMSYEESLTEMLAMRVHVTADYSIGNSKAKQAAFLTAAAAGMRAFLGGVASTLPDDVPLLLPWPGARTLNDALRSILEGHQVERTADMPTIAIGNSTQDDGDTLFIHCDGWRGGVAPDSVLSSFTPGPDFALGGIVGASLAVHGAFLRRSGIDPEAGSTATGLSLWSPGSDWVRSPPGPALQCLPKQVWALGLGHLGQGFLWSMGMLSFDPSTPIRVLLQDFDRVSPSNWAAGLLCSEGSSGATKARVAAGWLERRGFETNLVERRFDGYTRRQYEDPHIAFCAFDSLKSRRDLDSANIPLIVECGIGGGVDTFDKLSFHTLPYPSRTSAELWKDGTEGEDPVDPDLLAKLDPGLPCGVLAQTLARTAISTPFVGVFAGALGVAEILRAYHGGLRLVSLDGQLRSITTMRSAVLDGHDLLTIGQNGFVPAL
jgi:hypothetical protein